MIVTKKAFSEDYEVNGIDILRQPLSEDYKIADSALHEFI